MNKRQAGGRHSACPHSSFIIPHPSFENAATILSRATYTHVRTSPTELEINRMRPSYRTEIPWRGFIAALLTLSLVAPAALARQGGAATAAKPAAASSLTAAEREALARVRVETVREVTTALSSKEMEGRGTAQPGGERAAKYLADRFQKLGLKPLGDGGTYLQAVKFKSGQVLPETSLKAGDAPPKHGAG